MVPVFWGFSVSFLSLFCRFKSPGFYPKNFFSDRIRPGCFTLAGFFFMFAHLSFVQNFFLLMKRTSLSDSFSFCRGTFLLLFFYSISCICPPPSSGQVKGGQHTKLFDLFAMEKYEDCAFKAENMAMNEKYRKDPEPLLYLSMCFFKISNLDPEGLDQEYKDPLKESMKYAKKFRSKDKDGSMYSQNILFFEELKRAGITRANALYNEEQYSKAAAFYGLINNYDERDNSIRFMKGVCDLLAKNLAEGSKNIKDAITGLDTLRADSSFKADVFQDSFLVEAMIIYSDFLNKNNMADSAKKTMAVAKKFFPGNQAVKDQYNIIHGLEAEEKANPDSLKQSEKKYEFHEAPKDKNIQIPGEKTSSDADTLKSEKKEPAPELKEETIKPESVPDSIKTGPVSEPRENQDEK